MLSDELEYLNKVRTGQEKPACLVCGARAMIMRRESIPDGSEQGNDPKTGKSTLWEKFKPGIMKWYCRNHAPAPIIAEPAFAPQGRESR